MSYSTPDNAFILDTVIGDQFIFQFIPETIEDDKGSNWALYDILGRSSPLRGYKSGPSRTISFTVRMWASPTAADGRSPGKVKQDMDFLLALPYPDYSDSIAPPHLCIVHIGENIEMQGVCTNAKLSINARDNVWDLGPGFSHGVNIAMRFEETLDDPLDVYDRMGGAG